MGATRVLLKTSPSFVDSIGEILGPLLAGTPSVIATDADLQTPATPGGLTGVPESNPCVTAAEPARVTAQYPLNLAERLPHLWLWILSGEAEFYAVGC